MPFLPPPAVVVEQPPQQVETRWKLSLYGVQRSRETTTRVATGRCFDERGTYRYARDVRFSSVRALVLTHKDVGGIDWLIADGDSERLRLKGSVATTVEDDVETAGCDDLNPDGSQRWVKRSPDAPGACEERTLRGYRASVHWGAGRLTFNASGDQLQRGETGEPEACSGTVFFPQIKRVISLRRLLASRGKPVVLAQALADRTRSGASSSDKTERTTVYVELRRIG